MIPFSHPRKEGDRVSHYGLLSSRHGRGILALHSHWLPCGSIRVSWSCIPYRPMYKEQDGFGNRVLHPVPQEVPRVQGSSNTRREGVILHFYYSDHIHGPPRDESTCTYRVGGLQSSIKNQKLCHHGQPTRPRRTCFHCGRHSSWPQRELHLDWRDTGIINKAPFLNCPFPPLGVKQDHHGREDQSSRRSVGDE